MPVTLWSDDFESGAALAVDYTLDGAPTKTAGAAKNGAQGLNTLNEFDGVIKILGTQGSEGSTSFWVRSRHRSVFGYSVFEVRRVTFVLSIYAYTDGTVEIYDRLNTLRGTTAAGVLPTEVWKFVRVEWKLTPTAAPLVESYVKLYVGDTTSPSLVLDTGLLDAFTSTDGEWDRGFLSPKGDADDWGLFDGPVPVAPVSPCAPGFRIFPIGDVLNEGWDIASWDLVDDPLGPDDGTFTQSPSAPLFGQGRLIVRLSLGRDPGTTACYVLRYRLRKSAAGGSDLGVVVRLWQGMPPTGVLIAEWTHEGLGSDFLTYEQTLSDAQAALITDFANLLVEFDPYQG